MLKLLLPAEKEHIHILCLGAHCDDIEIGCGATLLELASRIPSLTVTWVVFSSNEVRAAEARQSSAKFLVGIKKCEVKILNHRNGYFPYCGAEIKEYFEDLKQQVNPDIIFTHHTADSHQDHRVVAELTWNTFRDHFVLEYEIPKYDGDLGRPNFFVPVGNAHVQNKSAILLECFESQQHRGWFTKSTFEGLMRLRGNECNSGSGFAEAFFSKKTVAG